MTKRKLKTNAKKVPKAKRQTLAQLVLAELRAMRAMREAFTTQAKGTVGIYQTDLGPVRVSGHLPPGLRANSDAAMPWFTSMGERVLLGQMDLAHLASVVALLLRKTRQGAAADGSDADVSTDDKLLEASAEDHVIFNAARRELMRRLAAND